MMASTKVSMRSLDLLFPRTSWPSLGFGLSPMAVATATKAVAQQSQPMVVFDACGCPGSCTMLHYAALCCTVGFLIVEICSD